MTKRIARTFACIAFTVATAALATRCASGGADEDGDEGKAERVTLAQVPAAARAAIEKLTAGGTIEKIDRETEKGRVIYDVEATVGSKHVEYTIADADGAVIGTETSIEFADLPAPVRAAAEKHFGSSAGLKAMKGVEEGVTSYEVEGTKGGKRVEAVFDPDGKLLEQGP